MRTVPTTTLALFTLAASATAVPLQFAIDPVTGRTVIEGEARFAGFTLESTGGNLRPENIPYVAGSAQTGIMFLDEERFIIVSVFSNTSFDISAGNSGNPAPGFAADGEGYEISNLVDVSAYATTGDLIDDLSVTWLTDFNTVEVAPVVLIPEPSTLASVGLAGTALLRRRR
ncbi:MAG: PEP-CTERM sorting domain-containing protein [Planctomycetota bacterium]